MDNGFPRRILMTADAIGGVWTYALELASALAPQGVEIALATMGAPVSPAQRAELAALPNVELFESAFRLEWMDDPWPDVDAAGDWLLDLAARIRPDLVHLNGYAHGALPWSHPTLIVAHSCVLSWWAAVKGEPAPARFDEYRRRVGTGLAAADRVAAPTRAMLDALENIYGPLRHARVIGNARDPALFAPAAKERRVMSAGRWWDQAKNIGALEAAAPFVDAPICVAGEGADAGHLRALGKLTPAQMAAELGRSAIYALPARYEPFGLSALEAGLSGCALVLGDIPSLREVWGDAALFVAPEDHPALARTLNALLDDPARREEHGHRAHRRARHFSPWLMAQNYLAAYRACRPAREEVAA